MICHATAAPERVGDDNRARNFAANTSARRMLTDRYGDGMVRAGALRRSRLFGARSFALRPEVPRISLDAQAPATAVWAGTSRATAMCSPSGAAA